MSSNPPKSRHRTATPSPSTAEKGASAARHPAAERAPARRAKSRRADGVTDEKVSDAGEAARWRRRSDARPGEIIDAAIRVFGERGYAAARLDDVAAAAGVTKGTVYLYFESKEKLFEAMVRQVVAPRIEQIDAVLDAFPGTTDEAIRTLIHALRTALGSSTVVIAKLIIAECGNFPHLAHVWTDNVAKRGLALVTKLLERGIARGEVRPLVARDVAPLVVAPVFLLGLWESSIGKHGPMPIDPAATIIEHLEMLRRALAPEPATTQPTRTTRGAAPGAAAPAHAHAHASAKASRSRRDP
jgi:AcrR family transcriptional regulator